MAIDLKEFASGQLTTFSPNQALNESIVVKLGQQVDAPGRGQVAAGAVGNADVKITWCAPGGDPLELNAGSEDDLLWSLTLLPSATMSVGPIYLPSVYERIVDRQQLHNWVTAKLLGIGLDHLFRYRLAELPSLEVAETTAAGIAAALIENCSPALWHAAADGDPVGALLLAPDTLKTIRTDATSVEAVEIATQRLASLRMYPFDCGEDVLGVVLARKRLLYRASNIELQRLTETQIEYDRVGFKLVASADVQVVTDQSEAVAFKLVASQT